MRVNLAGVLVLIATAVALPVLAQAPVGQPPPPHAAPGQRPPPPPGHPPLGHRPPPQGALPPPPGHHPPPPPPPPPPPGYGVAAPAATPTVIQALPSETPDPDALTVTETEATATDANAIQAQVAVLPGDVAQDAAGPEAATVETVTFGGDASGGDGSVASALAASTGDSISTAGDDSSNHKMTVAWLLALSLALLAWWVASRRSHRLAQQTQQLSRQQRQLRSAHEHLRQQSAHLRNLSIHDPLTGTLNRQAFAGELRELLDHLSRFSRPLNLIVFDLDHFKSINDQRGHLAGDAALKLVVGIVREHLVSADLFGRFGGDEFLIACADQSPESCAHLANTIRAAVERKAPLHDPPLPGLTLSLGLAQANPDSGYLPDELFARADAALYEAKRRGRNQVVTADAGLATAAPPLHRHL